jgi:hypothetical protein
MKTLALLIAMLAGAAAAADGTLPTRPVLPRDIGVAPPMRIEKLETPLPQGTPVTPAEVPAAVRRAVVARAARQFNVAESAVVLVHAEQITWSDGSLGCPEPGMYYTQNRVSGYLIVARTAGGELAYHTDSRGQARSCGTWRPKTNGKLPEKTPARDTQPSLDH